MYWFRICNAGKTSTCQHTAEEVLDYPNSYKVEKKINDQCNELCQDLKKSTNANFDDIEEKATKIFAQEEKKAGKTKRKLDEIAKKIGEMQMAMEDKDTNAGVKKLNADFQDVIKKSGLDAKDQKDLIKSTNEAAAKAQCYRSRSRSYSRSGTMCINLKSFKSYVESSVMSKSSAETAKQQKISSRRTAFKAGLGKAKNGIKKYGSAESVAKASRAAAGAARGISMFMSARKPDGSIDEKAVVGGVLDVVDSIATFLPPPASIITGISKLFFSNGIVFIHSYLTI